MQIVVKEVANNKEFKAFYQFQNKLYKDCEAYVPTLDIDQKSSLQNDPALKYCKRKLFLAYKGDKVVGRVQAIINPRYNEHYNRKRLRFGWFDFEDDVNIAKALLDAAQKWGKEQGMEQMHGPLAYNTLGRQGMLVEGFGNTPPTNCLYNHPYYVTAMEELGFEKEVDWLQYKLKASQGVPEKLHRISDMLMKRYNLRILDIKTIKGEFKERLVKRFFNIYNESFSTVPNFIPFTEEEMVKTGNTYFKLLREELTCLVLDENDDIAAFGLCFPSLSEAFKKAKGKLFPFGWYHILKGYRKYNTIDLMLIGSNPHWASKGLSAIYHNHLATSFKVHDIDVAITNPQVDDNVAAIKVWESYDHEPYMRRRCWIKEIK